jgi:hypothetical protein
VTCPGVVAFISAEGGSGIGLRIEAWETVHGAKADQAYFLVDQAPQLLDRHVAGDVDELLLSLTDLPLRPALIVIDTLARSMVGGDENSAEDMGLLIAAAERIRQATRATVVLVHHYNKQGGARGGLPRARFCKRAYSSADRRTSRVRPPLPSRWMNPGWPSTCSCPTSSRCSPGSLVRTTDPMRAPVS